MRVANNTAPLMHRHKKQASMRVCEQGGASGAVFHLFREMQEQRKKRSRGKRACDLSPLAPLAPQTHIDVGFQRGAGAVRAPLPRQKYRSRPIDSPTPRRPKCAAQPLLNVLPNTLRLLPFGVLAMRRTPGATHPKNSNTTLGTRCAHLRNRCCCPAGGGYMFSHASPAARSRVPCGCPPAALTAWQNVAAHALTSSTC